MATSANIVVDQGSKKTAIVDLTNEDGTPFALTDYLPFCQMRKSFYSVAATNITVEIYGTPANGQVKMTFLPVTTESLKAGRYVYDIEVRNVNDSTDIKRVLQGIITISPQVTKV